MWDNVTHSLSRDRVCNVNQAYRLRLTGTISVDILLRLKRMYPPCDRFEIPTAEAVDSPLYLLYTLWTETSGGTVQQPTAKPTIAARSVAVKHNDHSRSARSNAQKPTSTGTTSQNARTTSENPSLRYSGSSGSALVMKNRRSSPAGRTRLTAFW